MNVAELVFNNSAAGVTMANILHYAQEGTDLVPFNVAAIEGLITALAPDWNAYVDLMAIPFQTDNVDGYTLGPVVDLTPGPGVLRTYVFPRVAQTLGFLAGGLFPRAGLVAGDYLPLFNAAKVSKLTGLPGRTKRGSIHLAGLAEADTTGRNLTGGLQAALSAVLPSILVSARAITIGADTYNFYPVVLSRTAMRRSPANPVGTEPSVWAQRVVQGFLNAQIGSQLSRKN